MRVVCEDGRLCPQRLRGPHLRGGGERPERERAADDVTPVEGVGEAAGKEAEHDVKRREAKAGEEAVLGAGQAGAVLQVAVRRVVLLEAGVALLALGPEVCRRIPRARLAVADRLDALGRVAGVGCLRGAALRGGHAAQVVEQVPVAGAPTK